MSQPLWSFEQLARLARFEDPEVRFWAADRIAHLYPDRAAEVITDLLFDDHDSTPGLVAGHLAKHGNEAHRAALQRGFRRGTGILAAQCLAALARQGAPEAPRLAVQALHRRDLGEEALALIVSGLSEMAWREPSEAAADAAREIVMHRPELYADPAALRGCLRIFGDAQIGDLAGRWITALHFKGIDKAEAGIRAIEEDLQLEDISWCLRTDRTGRVDLDRSLRALENGYDREVRALVPVPDRETLAAAFARGEFREMAGRLAALVESRALAAADAADPGDSLPRRLAALASGFFKEETLKEADRLGHAMHTWLISLLVSALVKTAGYRNLDRECDRAGADLDVLLGLAELESSVLVRRLPPLLAEAAAAAGAPSRDRLAQWCAATLEARGPFYPKVIALGTLGEMALGADLPLIVGHLSDENSHIYGAAEKALLKFGDEGVDAVRAELERGEMHPDALHSVLIVMTDLMTPAALALVLDHFDDFMEAAGPDEGAEHASMFGARELIPHLRRWLKRVEGTSAQVALQAGIGHALLLVGAIHNVPIPEEERILQAIEACWGEEPEGPGGTGASDPYVM